MLTLEALARWVDSLADVFAENRDFLTGLDSAIGDADHGINMARGFGAVREALQKTPPADVPGLFRTVSTTLIRTVGGASGPLYGTFFMKAGPLLSASPVDIPALCAAFGAGVEGIGKMGKSTTGEKTMLDAWVPALEALRAASGGEVAAALSSAAAAARAGMEKTIPMVATKGRASYLGERSAGHPDPGATSTLLLLEALRDAVCEGE